MLSCFYIGIFLYCGNSGGPIADIQPQAPPYPTEYMARQMSNARRVDAAQSPLDRTYSTREECERVKKRTCYQVK
jgi:antitoxin (DNA-binding transcriptional repressor) of toxin-antitoxin stability system